MYGTLKLIIGADRKSFDVHTGKKPRFSTKDWQTTERIWGLLLPWAATEGFEWGQGCFQVMVFTLSFWPWSGGWVRRGEVGRVSIGSPSRKLLPFRGLARPMLHHFKSLSDGNLPSPQMGHF